MKNTPSPHALPRHRSRALFAGLLTLSAVTGFAQSGGTGGGSTAAGGQSQADRDVEDARRATRQNADANGNPSAKNGGDGTAGGATAARPRDDAADAVERSRARNLPGAMPGDAPGLRSGGGAEAGSSSTPGTVDMRPNSGTETGSRPGSALGGLPSDGAASGVGSTSGANEAKRDSRTTARMIGETSFAFRDRAMTMAERELASGNALGSSILRGSANLSGAARTRVDDGVARANAARTELSKAISRARSANEDRWEPSRAEVVERYEAYVKALEEARAAAVEGGISLPDAGGTSATTPAPR